MARFNVFLAERPTASLTADDKFVVLSNNKTSTIAYSSLKLDFQANPTFTGTVTVPTAIAGAAAVNKTQMDTAVALKANLAGATFTGTVMVAGSSPRLAISGTTCVLDFVETDQAADAGRWRIQGHNGQLYFQPVTDGSSAINTPMQITRTGTVTVSNLNATGTLLAPVVTTAGQAVRTTAINAAVGQMQINGYEVGSTGARNIASLMVNGFVGRPGLPPLLQRSGNIVTFTPHIDQTAGAPTASTMMNIPVGFRPSTYLWEAMYNSSMGVVSRIQVQAAGDVECAGFASLTGTTFIPPTWTWITTNAWPASLPGVAA